MFRRKIEQDRKPRTKLSGHQPIERAYQAAGQPAPVTLVGDARIGETIRDHNPTLLERRPNDLLKVLSAVREVQSELDLRHHPVMRRVQENLSYLSADLCASGFSC